MDVNYILGVAQAIITSLLTILAIIGGFMWRDRDKRILEVENDVKNGLREHGIRHEELQKTVDKDRESVLNSTHGIRTLIGTDYVTKTEHTRAVDSINATMQRGFENIGVQFRQALKDMGLIKN